MSKLYCPGPSLIYAGVGDGGAYLHLGFCERSVRVGNVPKHRGVQVDLAGDMDFDVQFMGEEIYISLRLVRYDEAVLQLCKQRLGSSLQPTLGQGSAGAIGALLGLENNTYPLVVVSQYVNKSVFSDMVPGFILPRAYLADGDERELGVEVKREQVMWRSLATFGTNGSYVLFRQDIASLSLPDPG